MSEVTAETLEFDAVIEGENLTPEQFKRFIEDEESVEVTGIRVTSKVIKHNPGKEIDRLAIFTLATEGVEPIEVEVGALTEFEYEAMKLIAERAKNGFEMYNDNREGDNLHIKLELVGDSVPLIEM